MFSFHLLSLLGLLVVLAGCDPDAPKPGEPQPPPPPEQTHRSAWSLAGTFSSDQRSPTTATPLPSGKVLVTGGEDRAVAELYDPETGTWAATGSPAFGVSGQSATLLLSGKVLVTGGFSHSRRSTHGQAKGYLPDAELYDPATGTWSPTSGMSIGRTGHTATLLPSGKVLVTGGHSGVEMDTVHLATAELYDPETGTWTATGSMATVRGGHAATLLPSGKVLVTGGHIFDRIDDTGAYLATAEVYDPATGTWASIAGMATDREGHTATLLKSGKVLVLGGKNTEGRLATAEVYDVERDTWSPIRGMAKARWSHTTTLLASGRVLVTGGLGERTHDTAEVYDPGTDTWAPAGSMAIGRYSHLAARLPSGKVLVLGGFLFESHGLAEVYDPAKKSTWTPSASMLSSRRHHTATLLPSGKVLVTGGSGEDGTAELYDPATGTWSSTASMTQGRQHHTATLLPSGKVLVTGGGGWGQSSLATAEVYDPETGTWSPTGNMVSARTEHTATLLPSGKVLVAGGSSWELGHSTGDVATAELYDPATGTWTSTGGMGWGRHQHTATLLKSGKVLVAGGNGSAETADVYDPETGTWSAVHSIQLRRLRRHTATLLPSGKVLVAGGAVDDGEIFRKNGAWLFDPGTGTWEATGSMSALRDRHTATLLPSGRVLVTGGMSRSTDLAATEEYDPETGTWSPVIGLSTGRWGHQATLLPSGKVLVTGGGAWNQRPLSTAEVYDLDTNT